MCVLVREYERNLRKYLRHKHQYSNKSERDRKNRVLKFLRFCCSRGIKDIRNIIQTDYDSFMQYLSEIGYSIETRRKYRLALREFFSRAHLNINVNVQKSVKREKFKKFERLKEILKDCDIEQYKDEILQIL